MFDSASIIVGLEVGTSKVCAVVGDVGKEEGALNIIGLGQSPSRGVKKGEIVDPEAAEECIRKAIAEAEQMADVEIRNLYLGVTGGHLRGFNNRGVHPIVSADREITEQDVKDVIKNAKAINLPAQNHVICAIRQHFTVEGQDGITNPVGMLGSRVEVDVHVLHGNLNRLQNAIRTVKGLQLEVDDIVFNGLASALALLNSDQKELGSLVIDLGAGSTEYALYSNGIIKHTGVLAVGGNHVSNDLAYGLKLRLSRAEKVKLEHGSAVVEEEIKGQSVTFDELGASSRVLNLEHLRMIMSVRLEEIFQLICQDLEQADVLKHVRAGVFLCGGGSRVPKISQLAERVFQMPVSLGKTNSISGLRSALDQPEFATAIGLVKYGTFQVRRKTFKSRPRFTDLFDNLFKRS